MPYKRSLADCLESSGIVVRGTGDELSQTDECPTLNASNWTHELDAKRTRGGKGTVVLDAVCSATGEIIEDAPTLTARSSKGISLGNKKRCSAVLGVSPMSDCTKKHPQAWIRTSIVYRAADGDREYFDETPTMRSLTLTNGHQAGSGAVKVREYHKQRGLGVSPSGATAGQTYLERPMTATEYENVMGWESGSTAIGVTEDGKEIKISQTQRKKMLGNGIIPQEITELLMGLKAILEVID